MYTHVQMLAVAWSTSLVWMEVKPGTPLSSRIIHVELVHREIFQPYRIREQAEKQAFGTILRHATYDKNSTVGNERWKKLHCDLGAIEDESSEGELLRFLNLPREEILSEDSGRCSQ